MGSSASAMARQLVMGASRRRMLRPGGCTARHSASFARHHSCRACKTLQSVHLNTSARQLPGPCRMQAPSAAGSMQ